MMRVVLILVACCGAVKLDSGLSVTEMGTTQLLEMKNDLKHRLDTHELAKPGEKAVFKYFKQLILNTSIPRLTYSAVHDNATIVSHWDAVMNCGETLSASREGAWTSAKDVWTEKKFAHEECRTHQAQPNTTCDQCVTYTQPFATTHPSAAFPSNPTPVYHTTQTVLDVLAQSGSASYGLPRTFGDLKAWFDDYYNWHCVAGPCPGGSTGLKKDCAETCIVACLEHINNHENRIANCTELQEEFEHSTCTWSQHIDHDCNTFNDCKTSKDNQYNVTVDRTQGNHRRREVEYQIMKTIVCFIDLLVGDAPLTDTAKNGCQITYPMDFLALNFPHTTHQDAPSDVYIQGTADCSCTEYPLMTANCPAGSVHPAFYEDPIPCNEFEAFYYTNQGWFVSAPPSACIPCTATTP